MADYGTKESNKNDTGKTLVGEVKSILTSFGINTNPRNCVTAKCIGCMSPLSGQKGQKVCCKYCDTEQVL